MMRLLIAITVCLCASSSGFADDAERGIGKIFADAPLTSLDSKTQKLADVKGAKATVVVFYSFDCPVAASYAPALNDLAKSGNERGVALIAVCPTQESAESLKKSTAENKFTFPVFRDADAKAADALKAEMTPEAFVFDGDLKLRYRGRIDDGYAARLKKNARTTSFDLKDAVDAVLAGKPIATRVTTAIGCAIERSSKSTTAGPVTYHQNVAPILRQHCQSCHQPGGVGPFSLLTYLQAKRWADDIKEFTNSRQMPPWMPQGGVPLRGERKLSEQDIKTLSAWADAGAPEGIAGKTEEPEKASEGWRLGKPDLILTVAEPFQIGPIGRDVFRVFVMPTELTEDKWVIGYDVKPGNTRIVHHTLNFFDATGTGRDLERKAQEKADPLAGDRGPGYAVGMGVGFIRPFSATDKPKFGGIGGWAPGQAPQFLPEGAGWYLPAHSDFLLQVHYHRDGKTETDRTQVGLYFAKQPVKQPWQTVVANGLRAFEFIPANNANFVGKGAVTLQNDAVLHSVLPHMHLIGKSVKVTMTPPDSPPQVLVDIPHWDYNWQETYWFKEPIHAAAGTRLEIEAVYDNSTANPNNPNAPPKAVRRGEQTDNEMLFAFIGATSTTTPWERVRFRPTVADNKADK
jgi:peroxiredoxin/mono/diheme cytochrome c family protein